MRGLHVIEAVGLGVERHERCGGELGEPRVQGVLRKNLVIVARLAKRFDGRNHRTVCARAGVAVSAATASTATAPPAAGSSGEPKRLEQRAQFQTSVEFPQP